MDTSNSALLAIVFILVGIVLIVFAEPIGMSQLDRAAQQNEAFLRKHPRFGKYLVPKIRTDKKAVKTNIRVVRAIGIAVIGMALFELYILISQGGTPGR